MDVVGYMAAMTPVATVAVLPLAILYGHVLSVTAHGWMYVVLLNQREILQAGTPAEPVGATEDSGTLA